MHPLPSPCPRQGCRSPRNPPLSPQSSGAFQWSVAKQGSRSDLGSLLVSPSSGSLNFG
eukprot:gene25712-48338_t